MFNFEINAGGGWTGHVNFILTLDDLYCNSNYLEEIHSFCRANNIYFPIQAYQDVLKNYLNKQENGTYLIPKNFIDDFKPISSAYKYLQTIDITRLVKVENHFN